MKQKIFTAMTTSLTKDGNIDVEATKKIIEYNVKISKVDGLYINGSTGEFPMLTLEQKKSALDIAIKNTPKTIDLIAQVGSTSLWETIELGKYAIKIGYKKLSVISPFYFKSDFNQLLAYYKEVCSKLKVDIIPYYIPGLTGVSLSKDQIKKILDLKGVQGIKFSSPDIQLLTQVRHENPKKKIYWGWDEMMAAGLMADVDGFIGSTYSLNGKNARKLVEKWNQNKIQDVKKLTISNIKIIDNMVQNGLFETIKFSILDFYGLKPQKTTLPTKELSASQKKIAIKIRDEAS